MLRQLSFNGLEVSLGSKQVVSIQHLNRNTTEATRSLLLRVRTTEGLEELLRLDVAASALESLASS